MEVEPLNGPPPSGIVHMCHLQGRDPQKKHSVSALKPEGQPSRAARGERFPLEVLQPGP